MVLQESGEMYLETILVLQKQQGIVRSIDVAKKLGFARPTLSEQMKKFREEGLVSFNEENHILLTEEGKKIAEKTYERHTVITHFLTAIGVSPQTAEEDACRIEHYISDETFACMKRSYEEAAEK